MKGLKQVALSRAPLLVLIGVFLPWLAFAGHGGAERNIATLSSDRIKQLLDAGEKLVLIDLRPAKDYQVSRLPGARSLPLGEVASRFQEIPKSGRVILYCDCRAFDAANRAVFLEDQGYRNIFIMPEGFSAWVRRGYPVESAPR